jgi:hypothetical protein
LRLAVGAAYKATCSCIVLLPSLSSALIGTFTSVVRGVYKSKEKRVLRCEVGKGS